LKEQLASEDGPGQAASPGPAEPETPDNEEPWYIKHAGHFANDPAFDEIVRLGREYRQSLHPGPDNDYCL
jgi:hypothetical protein